MSWRGESPCADISPSQQFPAISLTQFLSRPTYFQIRQLNSEELFWNVSKTPMCCDWREILTGLQVFWAADRYRSRGVFFRYQFFNTVYASHMSGHAEFVSLIHCSSWTPRFSSHMATQMRDTCDLDVMTEHQIFIQCLWVNVTCAADQAAPSAEAHRAFPVRRTCVKGTVSFCVIHMRKNFVENIPACLYRNCTHFGKHIPNDFSEIEQSSWVKRTFIDEQVLKWKLEYKM